MERSRAFKESWAQGDLRGVSRALQTWREESPVVEETWLNELDLVASVLHTLTGRLRRACGEDVEDSLVEKCDGHADAVVLTTLTEVLRFARNACVNAQAQDLLDSQGLALVCCQCLLRLEKLHGGGTFEEWKEIVVTLGRVASQALTNLCVQHDRNKTTLLGSQESSVSLVAATCFAGKISDLKLLYNVIYLLHTLVVDSPDRAGVLALDVNLLVAVLQGAAFALQGLHAAEACSEKEAETTTSTKGIIATDPEHVLAAEVHTTSIWIVGQLINLGHAPQLLKASRTEPMLEQVLLSLWLGHRLEEADRLVDPCAELESPDSAIVQVFDAVYSILTDCFVNDRSTPPGENKKLILRLLGSYALDRKVYAINNCKRTALHTFLDELESITRTPETAPYGYRADLVRAISNLCFQNRENQDAVREKEGGIFAVLNQCGVDDNSPFLREWGIMAIRNLTEGNLENQKVIADLRIQGSVQTSLLEKAGLKVDISEDGTPKVVRM